MSALCVLAALVLGAPEIVAIAPDPLPLGATAEATGGGFEPDLTSVRIGEAPQRVILVEPTRLRFLVALDTPLGLQTLTVTTQDPSGGSTSATVAIVPPAPKISAVEPQPLLLGGLASVVGEGLDTVTTATLDGVSCSVTEQTDFVLVLEVPFSAALLGDATLRLESPSGAVERSVVVSAPAPEIELLIPNPVPAGSLVTVRGRILPLGIKVAIGAVEMPVLSVTAGASIEGTAIVVWVPRTMAPKSYDVVVTSGTESSRPAGPLIVEAAPLDGPEASGTYPGRVAAGAEVWVVGQHLAAIESVTGGLAVIACDRRSCRLASAGVAAGPPFQAALVGPSGAAVFDLEVTGEAPLVPQIDSVLPNPATRGRTLSVLGQRMAGVRSVVLGGVAQSITFVDADRIEVTVDLATPLGLETLFLSGNAGSAPMQVTVLDPLPVEPGPESVESDILDDAEPDANAEASRGGAGGCTGGPGASPLALGLLAWLGGAWLRGRRGSRPPPDPRGSAGPAIEPAEDLLMPAPAVLGLQHPVVLVREVEESARDIATL